MRYLSIVLFFFVGIQLHSQTLIKVVDKVTSESVPYAVICFQNGNKSVKSAEITNDKGELKKKITETSVISVSLTGYKTRIDTISPSQLKIIYLTPTNLQLEDVIVTGSAQPQRKDKSIYKVDVITNAQIKERSANNLTDLLTTQSGMRVEQNGTLGSSVRVQGLSGQYVKVLIDGVPVSGRVNGNLNLNQLNLQNVDHVEIIEGPMSVIYGSDAMAGVINIISKENSKKPFTASADLYYESIGKYNASVSASFHKVNHTFNVQASRNFFQGASLPGDPIRVKTWKPSLQYNVDANYIYSTKKSKLKFSTSYFNETYLILGSPRKDGTPEQTDSTLIYHAVANDAYNFTTRFVNKLDYSLNLNKNVFNVVGSYTNYARSLVTYKNDLSLLQKTTDGVDNQSDQKINSVLFRGIWTNTAIDKIELTGGPDVNLDHAIDQADFGTKDMTDIAGFLNVKYSPISTLSFQPGVRLIYNSLFAAPLVYSFNAKYNPTNQLSVRASYAKGFRSPTLKELYFKFTALDHLVYGNPDLKAEYSNNANAAVNYTIPLNKSSVGLVLTGFYNQMKNKIDYIQDPNNPLQAYLDNLPIDLYQNFGGAFTVKYQIFKLFTTETGINVTAVSKLSNQGNFFYSKDFTENLNYINTKYGFNVSLNYKYYGDFVIYNAIKMNDGTMTTSSEGLAGGYHSLDAQITKHFLKDKLDLTAGVKNAFNNTRVNITSNSSTGGSAGLVGYGRTVFVKLAYNLN
jgi:outer membrane receptor for ferrienterochelin and colicins